MKKLIALYASSRYWNDETEWKAARVALAAQMRDISSENVLITTREDAARMPEADRLAKEGILVHEVRPGVIATDMTSGVKEKYDKLIEDGAFHVQKL
ncbi:hypothetical protein HNQ56_004737 [Anaerotaenia torta]|uniref:hypothetical protein n=1 Tax=Anaerotaenia torta TaxID=433293 RepID=UPI003D1BEA66